MLVLPACVFFSSFASILIEYLYNVLVIMSHTFVHARSQQPSNGREYIKTQQAPAHTHMHASKFILPFSSSSTGECECVFVYRSHTINSIYRQRNLRKSLGDILSSTFITAVSIWYIVCVYRLCEVGTEMKGSERASGRERKKESESQIELWV